MNENEQQEQQAYILGTLLMLANRIQALGDKLDAQMTTKQWLLIAVILKSGNTAPALTDLAVMTGSSRQNVKKMALILEKQGLVELAKDAQDARILRVRLTEECMVYFAGRSRKEEKFMAALFNDFDGELTGGLFRGLAGLSRNILLMEAGSPADEKE
ncbi:MarR family winged helix-turn-helix transcriptional regulator [Paenibacillus sp. FSL R7-0331]|uniref:MarR family winged helix-turn-helix transcriptional regulator n=1 Tax=Paenibacillus sp. FSL R7-0331 TaxID=1536773 RepID=UPI0004F75E11|nr:MarR family transcriptional regulator [Paenibacillus sp. FSL R7-0331]AIQ53488.1 MarR family transcriptional regulator [Paenibacillus sp. FSL R7-0331]